jgi:hypothetical protein
MVDPLGEVLMKLLPDGLLTLLAPAAALPALVLTVPPPAAPLMPVVVLLEFDPLAAVPPAELLLCAKATLPENASAATNAAVASFMDVSPRSFRRETNCRGEMRSCPRENVE